MAVKKAVKIYSEAISRSRCGRLMGLTRANTGGSKRTRTADPLLVRQVLYQLSYAPGTSSAPVGGLSSLGFRPLIRRFTLRCVQSG